MTFTDRILSVINAGLQASDEEGYDTDHSPDLCFRCQKLEPAAGGDLCEGCRAFLLGAAEALAIDRGRADELLEEESDELDDPSTEWRLSFERATERLYKLASHGEAGPPGAAGLMWRFMVDHMGLEPQQWQADVMQDYMAVRDRPAAELATDVHSRARRQSQ